MTQYSKLFFLILLSLFTRLLHSQTHIKMNRGSEVSVQCKINGLLLHFINDTSVTGLSIPIDVALSMYENKFLSELDLISSLLSKPIEVQGKETVRVILRQVELGTLKYHNVNATVVNDSCAHLILGKFLTDQPKKDKTDYKNEN
jgi:hypothetical protein